MEGREGWEGRSLLEVSQKRGVVGRAGRKVEEGWISGICSSESDPLLFSCELILRAAEFKTQLNGSPGLRSGPSEEQGGTRNEEDGLGRAG